MKAFILLTIRTGAIPEVVQNIRRLRGVTAVEMTFGPYDAIVTVEADSLTQIARLVNIEIQVIPGVEDTLTCLAVPI
ncbi:MAG: Lrp/AsnC ligand binding domain-containing protein [Caldilineales bacterium]|nr:Lrp/AsnC ligand binding domain-containing protein [Caldilineales bacterium]